MTATPNILRKVLWPGRREKFDIDYFDILIPKRKISKQDRYKSGLYYSEKCGREIQYESGLELEFIRMLESSKKVRFYLDQPAKVPYWRGKVRRYYYPDFGVYLSTGEFVIVEIKEMHGMIEDRTQVKMEGLMDFCRKRGFGLLLTDGRHIVADLKKIKLNRKLEREILKALAGEVPLRKQRYGELLKSCGAAHNDLLRVILKHDLYYNEFPFRLRYGGYNAEFRQVFIE